MNKIIDLNKEIKKLSKASPEMPFNVWRLLIGKPSKFSLFGSHIGLPSGDADYGSIEEWRNALEWLVDQFGGKVKWTKK